MMEPIMPIPQTAAISSGDVALGQTLFRDRCLSGDGCLTCSFCHDTATIRADVRAFDAGDDEIRLPVDTSTTFNAVLPSRPSWEGNARLLADRARVSLFAPANMDATPATMRSLAADPTPDRRLREVHGRPPDTRDVIDALAVLEVALVTPDDRLDLHLRDDPATLVPVEQGRHATLKTIGRVNCHQGVNAGGDPWQGHGIFSPVTGCDRIRMVLLVPSLSNLAMTLSSLHDGSVPTLAVAVSDMALARPDHKSLSDQTVAIVAFLRAPAGRREGIQVKEAW